MIGVFNPSARQAGSALGWLLQTQLQSFSFKETSGPVEFNSGQAPINGLCGRTWRVRALWCNQAGCLNW